MAAAASNEGGSRPGAIIKTNAGVYRASAKTTAPRKKTEGSEAFLTKRFHTDKIRPEAIIKSRAETGIMDVSISFWLIQVNAKPRRAAISCRFSLSWITRRWKKP
jgi:hypothetical protein